jgi:6-methylsalicylate decarboxylase
MLTPMLVDLHQHIWTRPLLDALAERDQLPLVRYENGLIVLHSAAEQPYVIDALSETPVARAARARADGVDRAVIAMSSPIGIEALPRESALELIEAYLTGVDALGPEFGFWGPIAIDGADPDEVDLLLARGAIGISVTAGALAGPERLDRMGQVLERVSSLGVPLFVHPGRAPGQRPSTAEFGEPLWWRPLNDYVFQMQTAWMTFAGFGRREHPDLRVVFAMLAGGAPLLHERLAVRGGPPVELRDPNTFYETSSYGPEAIGMTAGLTGCEQLVYGSDRPVIDPLPTEQDRAFQINAANLFTVVHV